MRKLESEIDLIFAAVQRAELAAGIVRNVCYCVCCTHGCDCLVGTCAHGIPCDCEICQQEALEGYQVDNEKEWN
jgi:hypothetical protein